jgi:hypothetical protein
MRKFVTAASLAMLMAPAGAVVFGGSNLGVFGYPEADCRRPEPPTRPFQPTSQWEIDTYNSEVDSYNNDLRQFIACTREYLDNAQADIKRVQERMQEAIDRARR